MDGTIFLTGIDTATEQVLPAIREFGVAVVMLIVLVSFAIIACYWIAKYILIPIRDALIKSLQSMSSDQTKICETQLRMTMLLEAVQRDVSSINDLKIKVESVIAKVDSVSRRISKTSAQEDSR